MQGAFMRKKLLCALGLVLMAIFVTACASVADLSGAPRLRGSANRKAVGLFPSILDVKRKIVVTTFPLYEATQKIIAGHEDRFDLIWIQDDGGDIHSYEPTPQDVSDVKAADLVVYLGQKGDEWIEEIVNGEKENGVERKSIKLIDYFKGSLLPIEFEVNYMKDSQASEKNQAYYEKEDRKNETTTHVDYDEHFWYSLNNQQYLTRMIYQSISTMDERYYKDYYQNTERYCITLENVENEYRAMKKKTNKYFVIVADRFPFRYIFNDYKVSYSSICNTCNTLENAALSKADHLASIIDERKIPVVIVTESSDQEIAKLVVSKTKEKNQKILVFNSMQSVSRKDVEDGASYQKIMRENLKVLTEALK